jgi:hypothetical protein
MGKRSTTKTKKHAAEQRVPDYDVGNGKPPVEHQFKPGQSGNPKGPPRHRVNLWVWITRYMAMTQAGLDKLDREKLTAAQRTALNLVEKAMSGERSGAERMARYCIDRDEGRAVERLVINDANELTDEECDQVRQLLLGNHADADE